MRIEDLRTEHSDSRVRVVAGVTWEDSRRPPFDLFFETQIAHAQDLTCNPHAFLLACLMPAFCHGEKRIMIDAPIAPEMLEGAKTAMGWIRHWWYDSSKPVMRIEAGTGTGDGVAKKESRTGMFFSGGVDSLATLRANRSAFSEDHPWFIKDGLIVFGLETDQEDSFQHVLSAISGPSGDAGLNLIPVYTNARYLDSDWMFWERKSHDAIFASIAYAFTNRFSDIVFASTYDIPSVQPAGTHPLLDLAYSSSQLIIHHDSVSLSRLDKIKLIADWEEAFQSIRTCNQSKLYEHGRMNCGQCIKCIRTMLELEALGLLKRNKAFPSRDITPELILPVVEIYKTTVDFFRELITPLRKQSRDDLAEIIQKKINAYERQKEFIDLKAAFRAIVKGYDARLFNGSLLKLKRMRLSDIWS